MPNEKIRTPEEIRRQIRAHQRGIKGHGRHGQWQWIAFVDAKSHLVPRHLVASIVADMTNRHAPRAASRNSHHLYIDTGGMMLVNRPIEDFRFCGLKISMPSEEVEGWYREINSLGERLTDDGKPYYKVHGAFHRCLVLSPRQRLCLLEALKKRSDAAEQRADVFYAAVKEMHLARENGSKARFHNVPAPDGAA